MSSKINSRLNQHSGTVLNWQKEASGISGNAEHGKFRVTIYSDYIVRIQLTREDFFEDFSYSVVAKPSNVNWDIADASDSIRITTSKLALIINKNSLTFHFQNHDGQTVNK